MTKETLNLAFLPFGEIIDVTLPNDPHRGFGYVEFENPDDAKAAIDNMDQSMLAGRVLSVAQAKPQKDVSNMLNSKTAVWEQVRARVEAAAFVGSSLTLWCRRTG